MSLGINICHMKIISIYNPSLIYAFINPIKYFLT